MFPNKLRKSYGDWRTNSLFPIQKMLGPRENNTDTGGSPSYADEGFLAIQNAIALAYIKVKAGTLPPDLPKIKMNILPYPPFLSDLFLNALGDLVPYLILLSFVCSCANIVRYIAIEKEKQLKEAMKIMGLPNWLHWTGWFVKSLIYMIIVITFMTVLLKVKLKKTTKSHRTHYTNLNFSCRLQCLARKLLLLRTLMQLFCGCFCLCTASPS